MSHVEAMLKTHGQPLEVDALALAECIEACLDCEKACTSCADACLGEPHRDQLIRCIRLNQDCANICDTTGRLLSRQTQPDWGVLRAQVSLCARMCRVCGDECRTHAEMHEHCRVCAESCQKCLQACDALARVMPAA